MLHVAIDRHSKQITVCVRSRGSYLIATRAAPGEADLFVKGRQPHSHEDIP